MNREQLAVNSKSNTEYALRNKTIGLVTYSGLLDLTPDERALAAALAELDVAAVAVAWDEARVDWAAFAGLVVRCAWNYHERPFAFRVWLDRVERAGVPLWNAPQTIRWNMEKTYLHDLAQRGVAIVPTVWLEKGETAVLANILIEQGWTEAVVKPVISASAYETWVTALTEPVQVGAVDQDRFEELLARKALMVQQKMPIEQGEWSLVFLGGEYSHAVLKRPQSGDFRVQEEHGGSSTLAEPPEWLSEQAKQVLKTVPDCLYARVDGMDINGRFVLMELELIEPALFLGLAAGSVERFAEQLVKRLNDPQISQIGSLPKSA